MFEITIKNINLTLETNDEIFSPSSADKGTLAMLSEVDFKEGDKVLDLGCGCGIVGILAAKLVGETNVTMCDVSEYAIAISKENAAKNDVPNINIIKSDGFSEITESNFTLILSNPPYHTDFSVAKGFIENGFNRLSVGGKMVMVTKRLDWYKNKLSTIFGGVKTIEKDGYFIFISEKRNILKKKKEKPPQKLSKKLKRKQNARKDKNEH